MLGFKKRSSDTEDMSADMPRSELQTDAQHTTYSEPYNQTYMQPQRQPYEQTYEQTQGQPYGQAVVSQSPAPTPAQSYAQAPQNTQLPYEIYEKVHEPTARRRRWAVRLVAALLTVTLLIIGGIALRDKLNVNTTQTGVTNKSATDKNSQQSQQKQNASASSQQDPQTNAPIQKVSADPATTPQSDATNTGTVTQPQ